MEHACGVELGPLALVRMHQAVLVHSYPFWLNRMVNGKPAPCPQPASSQHQFEADGSRMQIDMACSSHEMQLRHAQKSKLIMSPVGPLTAQPLLRLGQGPWGLEAPPQQATCSFQACNHRYQLSFDQGDIGEWSLIAHVILLLASIYLCRSTRGREPMLTKKSCHLSQIQ